METSIRRAGSVHPNPHAKEGDGATGHRVNPALSISVDNLQIMNDTEDTVIGNDSSSISQCFPTLRENRFEQNGSAFDYDGDNKKEETRREAIIAC
jgi:hypothetical protein